jgi:hypothetical protein
MAGDTENSWGRGSRWSLVVWAAAGLLLLAPLVAMQFTEDVVWTAVDFATFGAMLATACGAFELALRASSNWFYRIAVAVAEGAAFLLVWVNLAVGFLGDEGNRANMMFLGVIAVAILGSTVAGFRPAGMARAMLAAAATQVLVGVVGLAAGWASPGNEGLYEVSMGTSLFTALWLISAWLFSKAGRERAAALS